MRAQLRTSLHVLAVASLLSSGCNLLPGAGGGGEENDESTEASEGETPGEQTDDEPVGSVLPESEPNDELGDAQVVRVGRPIEGTLGEGDIDMYRIEAAPGDVRIRLTAGGTAEMDIQRPRDGASFRSYFTAEEEREFGPYPRDTATILRVEGEGDYELFVSASTDPAGARPCGFAREQDTREQPGIDFLAVPAQASACLQAAGDTDWFVIPAEAMANTDVMGVQVDGIPSVSLDVTILDQNDNQLANLVGGPGESVLIPNVGAPESSPVFIRVRSLAGANDRDDYVVTLRRVPNLGGLVEVEPNDEVEAAMAVLDADSIHGYLHRPGDTDYYSAQWSEPRVVRLMATSPQGVDLLVMIAGDEEEGTTIIDDTSTGVPEALCATRVSADNPLVFGIGARSIEEASDQPYQVNFEIYSADDFEAEPNDTAMDLPRRLDLPTADVQGVGVLLDEERFLRTAAGHIFPAGDIDLYAVDVLDDPLANITYSSVTLRLDAGSSADYRLELLDDEGGVIARADNGRRAESEEIALDLPSGRYYARVGHVSGERCMAPYRLTVEQTVADNPEPMPTTSGLPVAMDDPRPVRDVTDPSLPSINLTEEETGALRGAPVVDDGTADGSNLRVPGRPRIELPERPSSDSMEGRPMENSLPQRPPSRP